MLRQRLNALFLIGMLLFSASLFSQCLHCTNPAAPAEYGGVFTATQYKNSVVQLWAAKPAIAVDGRDWYKVKKAGDTTFVGSGDTLTVSVDTTCKFIARNINNCTCGGTYYSAYSVMSNITVVDSPSVPQFSISYSPGVCSGSQTNIFLHTSSTLSNILFQYLRDDTSNVSGSVTGSGSAGPLGITLTNRTGSPQVVRFVVRMFRQGVAYFDSKSFYVTVGVDTPASGDRCVFPSKPVSWPSTLPDVSTYAKGSHVQFFVDTTVNATSVEWFKVVGSDTTSAGTGYSVNATIDTAAKYIARSKNTCACASTSYYSAYTLVANYTVSSTYSIAFGVQQYMPTIVSGTGIDIVPRTDTSTLIGMALYRDNANITGLTTQSASINNTGTSQVFDAILTNTTNVSQRIRYYIKSTNAAGVVGNTYSGYLTVLPSSITAPAGNHCKVPDRKTTPGGIINYIKNATINLDLNVAGAVGGSVYSAPNYSDSIEWYRVRGKGDTAYVGSLMPVNTIVDTNLTIIAVAENVCYWSDSSKHIYKSVPSFICKVNANAGTEAVVTTANSTPVLCNGDSARLVISTPTYSPGLTWYRSNTQNVTGQLSGSTSGSSFSVKAKLSDTVTTPQKVYFVSYYYNGSNFGSHNITSVTVYPDCSKWAGLATAIRTAKDSICSGDTSTLTADTIVGKGPCHYAWSTGDTTKSIRRTSTGTYTVTVSNSCGCSASASKVILVFAVPAVHMKGDTICLGEIPTISADTFAHPTYHYAWNSGDSGMIIHPLEAGVFSVTVSNAICSATGEALLVINAVGVPTLMPQAVGSDSIVNLAFDRREQAAPGWRFEWSLDSIFTSPTATDSFGFQLSPDTSLAIWLRNVDSISGCVSSLSQTMAIVWHPSNENLPADTLIAGCQGTDVKIPIMSSRNFSYQLWKNSVLVDSARGTGDTLLLSSGILDSSEVFSVIAVDTLTRAISIIDSAIYVWIYPPVSKPIFMLADSVISSTDTLAICFQAMAENSTRLNYSILDSGTATIDSVSGCLLSVTSDFTVRARAWGLPSCGETYTDVHVILTDIGEPYVPEVSPILIDTPQTVTFVIDSVMPGTNADRIEWSGDASFKKSHILSVSTTISVSVNAPIDTSIFIRSYKSSTSQHGIAKELQLKSARISYGAGILDKRQWIMRPTPSDEFTYSDKSEVSTHISPFNGNGGNRKWWFNFCWGNQDCDPSSCANHYISNTDEGIVNTGNIFGNGVDGSQDEITFNGRYATLKSYVVPGTPHAFMCDGHAITMKYRLANLASRPINLDSAIIVEARVKRTAGPGAYDCFWLHAGSSEYDIFESPGGDTHKDMVTYHETFHSPYSHCGMTLTKTSACDFTEDWHVYDFIYTGKDAYGGRMYMVVDGKVKWSRHIDNWWTDNKMNIWLGFASSGNLGNLSDMFVDYCRVYRPALSGFYNRNTACLQKGVPNSILSGTSITLEQTTSFYTEKIQYSGIGFNQVHPSSKLSLVTTPSSKHLFFQGWNGNMYHLKKSLFSWTGERINGTAVAGNGQFSVSSYVGSDVTPASEILVFYRTTSNILAFVQKQSQGWVYNIAKYNNGRYVNNCAGLISTDALNRAFYKGTDNNIYAFENNQRNRIPNVSPVSGAMIVASCGCLIFYVDDIYHLHQMSWNNGWQDFVVGYSLLPTSNLAFDDVNSRVYYIGLDHAVYYYRWDYSRINVAGTVKLDHNSTEFSSRQHLCSSFENAVGGLAVDGRNDRVYYTATDGSTWYYFNDHETFQNFPGSSTLAYNWNKTAFESQESGAPRVLESSGEMYYRAQGGNVAYKHWQNADAPIHCPLTTDVQNQYSYKKKPKHNSANDYDGEDESVAVSVYPNPSENIFNIEVYLPNNESDVSLEVTSIEGEKVYESRLPVTNTKINFSWNSSNVAGGIYFYTVSYSRGRKSSGRMIKL